MSSGNDVRGEIRQFLVTRRAKLTPAQASLPAYGGRRRVPGLRREEVALLAGISIEYYARPARRRPTPQRVRPSVQRLLDSMTGTAAFLRNGRLDILAANQLGYALYAPAFLDPARPVNLARFIFLDPGSREFYRDWDGIANAAVGSLRRGGPAVPPSAGRRPDPQLRRARAAGRPGTDNRRLHRRSGLPGPAGPRPAGQLDRDPGEAPSIASDADP